MAASVKVKNSCGGSSALENVTLWIGLYPDELGRFVERNDELMIEMTKAQIEAADGLLDSMVIWGDVAYVSGQTFPGIWEVSPLSRRLRSSRSKLISNCSLSDHNEGDLNRSEVSKNDF